MQATKLPQAHQQIVDLLIDTYLSTKNGLTIKEIAERLTLNRKKASALLNFIYRETGMLVCSKEERPTYSRDYPMMQHGYTRVYVWEPSKDYLADLLKEANLEIAELTVNQETADQ